MKYEIGQADIALSVQIDFWQCIWLEKYPKCLVKDQAMVSTRQRLRSTAAALVFHACAVALASTPASVARGLLVLKYVASGS